MLEKQLTEKYNAAVIANDWQEFIRAFIEHHTIFSQLNVLIKTASHIGQKKTIASLIKQHESQEKSLYKEFKQRIKTYAFVSTVSPSSVNVPNSIRSREHEYSGKELFDTLIASLTAINLTNEENYTASIANFANLKEAFVQTTTSDCEWVCVLINDILNELWKERH